MEKQCFVILPIAFLMSYNWSKLCLSKTFPQNNHWHILKVLFLSHQETEVLTNKSGYTLSKCNFTCLGYGKMF